MASNLPGPAACARLREWGAEVTKVEPPAGDPFAAFCPGWYSQLHAGMEVHRIDLKAAAGQERMHAWLDRADVLVTAQRPSALDRLGLHGEALHARHARLCHALLTGHPGTQAEEPGHDLTYLAEHDLLTPPAMPPTLFADMAGAERLVSAVLALVHQRDRTGRGASLMVAFSPAPQWLAPPRGHRPPPPGAPLGGGDAGVKFYEKR